MQMETEYDSHLETLNITTLWVKTLNITALWVKTLNITTLWVKTLSFTTLCATNSADDKLILTFLFSKKIGSESVFFGDNLHEMSKPLFSGKK